MEGLTEKQLEVLRRVVDGEILAYINGIPGVMNPEVFLGENTKVSLKDFHALNAAGCLAYVEGEIGNYRYYTISLDVLPLLESVGGLEEA